MAKNHWLVKQEPGTYSWDDFLRERITAWTGVRNFQARNNLRLMKKGDLVLFYHSGEDREIVGVARVVREAYPDPTGKDDAWSAVDLEAVKPLGRPVRLDAIKTDRSLDGVPLLRQSRLSVMPLTKAQFDRIIERSRMGR